MDESVPVLHASPVETDASIAHRIRDEIMHLMEPVCEQLSEAARLGMEVQLNCPRNQFGKYSATVAVIKQLA